MLPDLTGIKPRQNMVIKTKFNIGDTVWYMRRETPVAEKVGWILLQIHRNKEGIYYGINANEQISEENCFATKKELRDFVFGTE